MAYVNSGVQSHRPQIQPQVQKGWIGRAVGAIKDVLTGPAVSTQGVKRGPDGYERNARIDVNRPRQLNALNAGRGADNSRGTKSITVPDHALFGFLDEMSQGKHG